MLSAGRIAGLSGIFGGLFATAWDAEWTWRAIFVAGLLLGKNYLDYSVLAHDPAHGHELGIFLVEAGVLITVAGTMTSLFYAFVERGR